MDYSRITATTASGEPITNIPMARHETVYEAIARNSTVSLKTTCRGSTICGLCRVTVEEGAEALPPVQPDERALLGEAAENVRLACRISLPASLQRLVVSTPYWQAPAR